MPKDCGCRSPNKMFKKLLAIKCIPYKIKSYNIVLPVGTKNKRKYVNLLFLLWFLDIYYKLFTLQPRFFKTT